MEARLLAEVELLRTRYPDLEIVDRWIRLPSYAVPEGWTPRPLPVAFLAPLGYPGTPPDNFCVPAGTRFNGQAPNNWGAPSPAPPFQGSWMQFSWHVEGGDWRATADPRTGSNLLNWAQGFSHRFREGL